MCKFREAIKKHRDGVTLDLFVTPKTDSVVFPAGYNRWRKRAEIKVCSQAKENRANKEVVKTVAEYFHISVRDVMSISEQSGHKNQ